jgi:hypothetical protein
MANEPKLQDTSITTTQSFSEGMVKDVSSIYTKKGTWFHARNLSTNNHNGEEGVVGSEPANKLCCNAPYPIIGYASIEGDQWVVFSTDDVNSEIGIFDESECRYEKKVNQADLNFKQKNIIRAVTKKNQDCSFSVYWSDPGNSDRCLNFNKIPYIKLPKKGSLDNCSFTLSDKIDIEQLRISPIIKTPSYRLQKGRGSGSLLNGTYQVAIAYTTNGIRVSDYFKPSNAQSLWTHQNTSGSLEVLIDEIDTDYTEFELVILSNINLQTTAKKLGIYSTAQKVIVVDYINQTLPTIPLEDITTQTPAYDKSDNIVEVNNYLLRIGVRTKPDFNYQPQANKIVPKWVAMELPADYYYKGGNITSYPRDEQQPFFIRWIYNSGKSSADYPIIGRVATATDLVNITGTDVIEQVDKATTIKKWQVENTATILNIKSSAISEGKVIAEGNMGYWESTELYPSKLEVWGDLCGKPIRHSKFPDNALVPHFTENGTKIVVLGVKFENITHPLDENGDPIPDIVGYEFLKASREGNKTIIAKGILNNAGEYTIPNGISDKKGLYPNYPYNDLRTDPFLSKERVKGGCADKGYSPMGSFRKDVFTFHSPETQFRNPYLSSSELRVYGQMNGTVTGKYEPVFKHPRHKLIRDFALIVSGLIGVGEGLLAVKGKTTTTVDGPKAINIGMSGTGATTFTTLGLGGAAVSGFYGGTAVTDELVDSIAALDPTGLTDKVKLKANLISGAALGSIPGTMGSSQSTTTENTAFSGLPTPLRILGGAITFSYYFSQGTEATLRIIKNLVPFQQYAQQYNSHGFYNQFVPAVTGNKRRRINDAEYLESHLQEFTGKYRVNNLFRGRQVIIETDKELQDPSLVDDTRQTIGTLKIWDDPKKEFVSSTSAHYAALKIPMANQFGQIDSMNLIPISTRVEPTTANKDIKMTSSVLFGGDIYINRYTEKNTFFYFNEWLHDQMDGTEMNYNNHYNVPNPRYWINTEEYDISQLTSALVRLNFKENVLPNDLAHLDRKSSDCSKKISFVINQAYFYLFNSGIRDFFVESEINLAQRDYDELDSQRHYDYKNYTDTTSLFRSDVIKAGNHYKYDYSLSVSKLLFNNISWGSVLGRDYDPTNQKCYSYFPKRVIYSLQQQYELKRDNWLVYLANNYKDFQSHITQIKEVNATGALILFNNDSPLMFQGIDHLSTESGIKVTIGDGGLFEQPLQSVTNSNRSYEYGSCQNKLAIENTDKGLFWISADQGKIFSFTGQLQDITIGMKYWFAQYLPFRLLLDFPDFELNDNPLIGISTGIIYDNTTEVLYFTKKDWELKSQYKDKVSYAGGNKFTLGNTPVLLGDKNYFNSASFTVSYDSKERKWISYHDWHPSFLLPSKTHFLTVKDSGIWKHNQRCDLYCNYYGVDYPFAIEYNDPTGQEVTTLRSIEYQMEAYKYFNECRDAHHILDENFDRLIVYNTEQISGLIKLQIKPKNSPLSIIRPTQSESEGVSMYCSKEENKYRISGITDLTRDRGEFSGTERQMFVTEPNGYIKSINPVNINYSKSILQRKKMRHYNNRICLQKNKCGATKFLLHVTNNKLLRSPR